MARSAVGASWGTSRASTWGGEVNRRSAKCNCVARCSAASTALKFWSRSGPPLCSIMQSAMSTCKKMALWMPSSQLALILCANGLMDKAPLARVRSPEGGLPQLLLLEIPDFCRRSAEQRCHNSMHWTNFRLRMSARPANKSASAASAAWAAPAARKRCAALSSGMRCAIVMCARERHSACTRTAWRACLNRKVKIDRCGRSRMASTSSWLGGLGNSQRQDWTKSKASPRAVQRKVR
mmetsp:Transcript_122402/g.353814  ORF Transcript_122402/g.353814 Transcript_122402/m.353814 type:complete len:237 (+) Transcript_122402:106-816(+)